MKYYICRVPPLLGRAKSPSARSVEASVYNVEFSSDSFIHSSKILYIRITWFEL